MDLSALDLTPGDRVAEKRPRGRSLCPRLGTIVYQAPLDPLIYIQMDNGDLTCEQPAYFGLRWVRA